MFAQTCRVERGHTHVRTSAGWSRAPVDCGHVSSPRITCPRQCKDPEWLGDWTTKKCRNVLSAVRQVVLLLVTMRLLAECCPDHTCRRCLIMFGMWSKSPRRHLFCFLSNVPSSKAPSYFKNIWRHTKWASDKTVYNDLQRQTVEDPC